MLKELLFLSKIVGRGSEWLLSLLVMLEKISVSLIPKSEDLNGVEYNKNDNLDDIAVQWSSLWESLSTQGSTQKYHYMQKSNLASIGDVKTSVLLQVVDFKLLKHVFGDSSVKQIQSCHRNAGDPAADDNANPVYLSFSSINIFGHQYLTYIKKHRKTITSFLCFFYFNPVKS
ncbi:hypothetical protein L4D09_12420 [Photobacterium makurazakiensis]|uniref:hypothetical protein n=1 Tax=Photobacterium makurazakiensis TaxID=2910234 RepID=UPI003D14B0F0